MQPVEVMAHEPGPEPDGIPFVEVMIDAFGGGPERRPRTIELSIVSQVVHPDLKSIRGQEVTKRFGSRISSFGNKVERRTKTQALLQFHQLMAPIKSLCSFHIMGQDEGELFSPRPTVPRFWFLAGRRVDRPGVCKRNA